MQKDKRIRTAERRKTITQPITKSAASPTLPDFLGRLEKVFGTDKLAMSGAEIVRMDRDRFYKSKSITQ